MNFKLGRFEDALRLAIESLEGSDEKEESELSKIIGESYFNLEEYRLALSYLPDYKGKNGKFNNTHYYQLGYSNYKLKNYKEAIFYFDERDNKSKKNLINLMSNPIYEIESLYKRKAFKRTLFIKKYFSKFNKQAGIRAKDHIIKKFYWISI